MSYCRFSSDDWRSDVYVYESHDGWVVHVAGSRGHKPVPAPDMKGLIDGRVPAELVAEQVADMRRRIEERRLVPIDHPLAGESRTFGEPSCCADWLEHLMTEGFHVPEHVVPALREEAIDSDADDAAIDTTTETDTPTTITTENAEVLGYAALMRVDSWLCHIDDDDEEIRRLMRDTAQEAGTDGETRSVTGDADLDAVLPDVRSIRIVAHAWPRTEETEFTILHAELTTAPSVLDVLGIARDAYLTCMHLAGRTNNGGGGCALDENLLAFAAGAEGRLRENAAISSLDLFDPRPTVYCSYTAWWEGCRTSVNGAELILSPSLGS